MPQTRATSTASVDNATFKNLDHPANNVPAIVGSRRAKQAVVSAKARGKRPAPRSPTLSEDDIQNPSDPDVVTMDVDDPIEDDDGEERPSSPSVEFEFGNSPRFREIVDHHPDGEGGNHDVLADIYFPAHEDPEDAAVADDDADLGPDVRRTSFVTMAHESRSAPRPMDDDPPSPSLPPAKKVSFDALSKATKKATAAVRRAGLAVAERLSPRQSPVAGPSGSSAVDGRASLASKGHRPGSGTQLPRHVNLLDLERARALARASRVSQGGTTTPPPAPVAPSKASSVQPTVRSARSNRSLQSGRSVAQASPGAPEPQEDEVAVMRQKLLDAQLDLDQARARRDAASRRARDAATAEKAGELEALRAQMASIAAAKARVEDETRAFNAPAPASRTRQRRFSRSNPPLPQGSPMQVDYHAHKRQASASPVVGSDLGSPFAQQPKRVRKHVSPVSRMRSFLPSRIGSPRTSGFITMADASDSAEGHTCAAMAAEILRNGVRDPLRMSMFSPAAIEAERLRALGYEPRTSKALTSAASDDRARFFPPDATLPDAEWQAA
ncbi:hypothetical protein CYLTODRAFT_458390, partial [Cylindrobasidium torrendii FP15055 ss-10]